MQTARLEAGEKFLFLTKMDRLHGILSSIHRSVQTIENNTKANTRLANQVNELLRIIEAVTKLSGDKHNDKQVDVLESSVFYPSCEPLVQQRNDGKHGNTHLLNGAPAINHIVNKISAEINVHSAASSNDGGRVKSRTRKEHEKPEFRDVGRPVSRENHQRQSTAMWGSQSASDLSIAEGSVDSEYSSENSPADGHANDFTIVVNKRAAKRRRRRTKQDGISFAEALNKPVPVASEDPAVKLLAPSKNLN